MICLRPCTLFYPLHVEGAPASLMRLCWLSMAMLCQVLDQICLLHDAWNDIRRQKVCLYNVGVTMCTIPLNTVRLHHCHHSYSAELSRLHFGQLYTYGPVAA